MHNYHMFLDDFIWNRNILRDLNFAVLTNHRFSRLLNFANQVTGASFLNFQFCILCSHNGIESRKGTG